MITTISIWNSGEENDEDYNGESDNVGEYEYAYLDLLPEVKIDGEMVPYGMRDTVTEVNVREGITSIPTQCFMHCVNLDHVTLPTSLLSIGVQIKLLREFLLNRRLRHSRCGGRLLCICDLEFGDWVESEVIQVAGGELRVERGSEWNNYI